MKRIFAFVLTFALALSLLVSCGNGDVNAVADMYKNSAPTKLVAETLQTFGDRELKGSYTLVMGTVDGKSAATLDGTYQRIRSVTDGATEVVYGVIEDVPVMKEYVEGKGVRTDGKSGTWDPAAETFAPERGTMSLNLKSSAMKDITYDNHVLKFTVKARDTKVVFGEDKAVAADVQVEIVDDGEVVIGVSMSYQLPADEENHVEATTVTIKISYTYDNEKITIS